MERRILLIDATGLVFRAFYSISTDMTTPKGLPVNAVFGLVRMLMRVFREVPATASAVIFDAGKDTFRTEVYPDYKAQRPAPPDELRHQFQLAIDAARASQAPVFVERGFEADDLIATIARQARKAGHAVTVLTSDHDILQLLAPDCDLLMPARRGELTHHDLASFELKYGFPVSRFVDFKAIMGDPSDNIPGIRGIGEKGAAKLVSTYGKLEQIYGNIDMIKPDGVRKKLAAAKADVFLYRELVTLKDDVAVEYDFNARTLPDFSSEALQQMLGDLGFNRVREDALALGDLMADVL
jgi:DNA polymerase-1